MCGIEQNSLLLSIRFIYIAFHRYLGTWYLANDWFGWRSSAISLSGVIICSQWEQNMLFRYIPYMTGSFCSKNLDQAVSEKSQGK